MSIGCCTVPLPKVEDSPTITARLKSLRAPARISLAEALDLKTLAAYNAKATGEKYLINPNK